MFELRVSFVRASPFSTDLNCGDCLLLSNGAVSVVSAALKEAVTHHALPEQKQHDYEDDYKQEPSDFAP